MKAAVLHAPGQGFRIEEVVIDAPIGREVLVDVRASGLCHTDLTIARQGLGLPMPLVLGHEVAGVVREVGPDVTQFSVGDHVVACLLPACGSCASCFAGKPFQCPHPEAISRRPGAPARLSIDGTPVTQFSGLGGFAEQALIHENQLVVVSPELPFAQAAVLGCAVVTGAGAVLNTANVGPGESIVVVGAGGVGLNAVSGGRIAGAARIIAVDVDDDKLDKARRFGATDTVNSRTVDPVAAVRELTDGGANHVFDFVGVSAVSQQNLGMLGVGGTLYLVGASDPAASVTIGPIVEVVMRQIRVQGVNLGSSDFKRDIPYYADLYEQGRMNLDDLVTRTIALDEIEEAYTSLGSSGSTRVVITSF